MASIINGLSKISKIGFTNCPTVIVTRSTSQSFQRGRCKVGTIKHRNLIKSTEDSLAARGFLRSQKPYTPPADAVERVKKIVASVVGQGTANFNREQKFHVLNACFKEFNHTVPNSMLRNINTPMDVLNFYTSPVSTTNPYDELKTQVLPPNLHVQFDYLRFHPDTDTLFGGVTAFPQSSTLVTGLKYKGKYKGHKVRPPAHYDQWSDHIREYVYTGKD